MSDSPMMTGDQVRRYEPLSDENPGVVYRMAQGWLWAMEALAAMPCQKPRCVSDRTTSGGTRIQEMIVCGTCPTCLARKALEVDRGD